ncbi:hypothetical protein A9Q99_20200 [Gammaproteobacteria bacterium 45_16_T64]|nr:hypothetical protein A9Q99_20200 [Gammaproteobacteria bacterium 45_16_T64]
MKQKVILIEFNELTHELMEKFISEGHLPNFKRFYEQSQVHTTDANASGEDLNPWVQWVSLHSGLDPDEHGVRRLNDAAGFKGEFVWDKLSKAGLKSWICGSMNTNFLDGFNGMLIPDPWSAGTAPYPPGKFDVYVDFIQQSVQGHDSKSSVSSKDFVRFMLKNGLSLSTIIAIAKQLVSEKRSSGNFWKRASIMDLIQFDLFKYHFAKESPDLSSFFLNSVAHYQHHYWADMDPERFGQSGESARADTKEAILFGYKSLDRILGKFMQLADSDTVLVFCTALSQQPYVTSSPEEERHYFHIIDDKSFAQSLGITQEHEYIPVMAEQFHLQCESNAAASKLCDYLNEFDMDSNDYFHVGSDQVFLATCDDNTVHVQCRCTKQVKSDAKIIHRISKSELAFYDIFYHMEDVKAGVHNPKGMLWVLDPNKKPEVHKEDIALEVVSPMVQNYFS